MGNLFSENTAVMFLYWTVETAEAAAADAACQKRRQNGMMLLRDFSAKHGPPPLQKASSQSTVKQTEATVVKSDRSLYSTLCLPAMQWRSGQVRHHEVRGLLTSVVTVGVLRGQSLICCAPWTLLLRRNLVPQCRPPSWCGGQPSSTPRRC